MTDISTKKDLAIKALNEICAFNKTRTQRFLQHLEGLGASESQFKLAKFELSKVRRSYRKKLKYCMAHFAKGNAVGLNAQLGLLLKSRSARIIGQL